MVAQWQRSETPGRGGHEIDAADVAASGDLVAARGSRSGGASRSTRSPTSGRRRGVRSRRSRGGIRQFLPHRPGLADGHVVVGRTVEDVDAERRRGSGRASSVSLGESADGSASNRAEPPSGGRAPAYDAMLTQPALGAIAANRSGKRHAEVPGAVPSHRVAGEVGPCEGRCSSSSRARSSTSIASSRPQSSQSKPYGRRFVGATTCAQGFGA